MQRDEMPRAGEWRNKTEHKLTKGKIKQSPLCLPSFSLYGVSLQLSPQIPPAAPSCYSSFLFFPIFFSTSKEKNLPFSAPSCSQLLPEILQCPFAPKVLLLLLQIFLSQLLSWDPLSAFSPFFLSFSFFYLPQQATTDSTIAPLSKYGTSDHQHGRPS